MKKLLRVTIILQLLAFVSIIWIGEGAKALEGPSVCLKLCDPVSGYESQNHLGECWTVLEGELDEKEGYTSYCANGSGTCNAQWCDWQKPGCWGTGVNPGCAGS